MILWKKLLVLIGATTAALSYLGTKTSVAGSQEPITRALQSASLDDVRVFAETAVSEKNMMVVGYLPYMERLVSYLITGSLEIFVYEFQNSGIVCLDQGSGDKEKGWYSKWTLNPNIS